MRVHIIATKFKFEYLFLNTKECFCVIDRTLSLSYPTFQTNLFKRLGKTWRKLTVTTQRRLNCFIKFTDDTTNGTQH